MKDELEQLFGIHNFDDVRRNQDSSSSSSSDEEESHNGMRSELVVKQWGEKREPDTAARRQRFVNSHGIVNL